MSCKTVMVSLVLGRSNDRVLEAASRIAVAFGAGVIGVGVCRPIHSVYRDYQLPAGLFEEDRRQIERQIRDAEREFRAAMAGLPGRIDWKAHCSTEPLAEQMAREARSADLIVIAGNPAEPIDTTRRPDMCDLVTAAGRPVLLVPAEGTLPAFDRVLVGWKDVREARRAVVDALPFLTRASTVTVAEITAGDEAAEAGSGVADVVAWLAYHGVRAMAKIVSQDRANSQEFAALAHRLDAGLVVAGFSGYGRQGRWVLGGITSELLAGNRCALLSG